MQLDLYGLSSQAQAHQVRFQLQLPGNGNAQKTLENIHQRTRFYGLDLSEAQITHAPSQLCTEAAVAIDV